ncbi:MAG: NAD-dependent deacetylase [Promethearchaeota archaeon]
MSFSQEEIRVVVQAISEAKYLVVLTGAGISTESGIPDFRGPDGVWTRRDKGLPPKPMSKPLEEMEPNAGHYALVELQNRGILKFLISQNVDNLHLKSGIRPEFLAELHGNHLIMKCLECDVRYTKEEIGWKDVSHGLGYRYHPQWSNQPRCPQCGGRIISSVINFNDPMPLKEMQEAENHTLRCDLMIVIGSSLTVCPANNFPKLAKQMGAKLIIINAEPTPLDSVANLKFEAKSGQFLSAVVDEIKMTLKENQKG